MSAKSYIRRKVSLRAYIPIFISLFLFHSCGHKPVDLATLKACPQNLEESMKQCRPLNCKSDESADYEVLLGSPLKVVSHLNLERTSSKCKLSYFNKYEGLRKCKFPLAINENLMSLLIDFGQTSSLVKRHQVMDDLASANDYAAFEKKYKKYLKEQKAQMKKLKDLSVMKGKSGTEGIDFKNLCSDDSSMVTIEDRKVFEDLALKSQMNFTQKTMKIAPMVSRYNKKRFRKQRDNWVVSKEKCLIKKDPEECFKTGLYYERRKNFDEALVYYQMGCQKNHADSCTNGGYSAYKIGDRDNDFKLSSKGCQLKNGVACYNVACFHCFKKNKDSAVEYFKKAIENDFSDFKAIHNDPDSDCIKDSKIYQETFKDKL